MNKPHTKQSIVIEKHEELMRLDKLLVSRFPDRSRSYFQFIIENGAVLVNGQLVKKQWKSSAGDQVEISFLPVSELSTVPQQIPLDILYEDDYLIAINKPAGMVVHPAPGNPDQTFVNALLFHCEVEKNSVDDTRPGIVHRLDKDTSGVLIAAKTYETHKLLVEQFARREVKKIYLALCVGCPKEGILSAPIKRHPTKRKQMAISADGKEAISEISVLKRNERASFVQIAPKTGRTHQIRIHLNYLKSPVVGDEIYGSVSFNKIFQTPRQLLHAWQLHLLHPISKKNLSFEAPEPEDMRLWRQKLDLSF